MLLEQLLNELNITNRSLLGRSFIQFVSEKLYNDKSKIGSFLGKGSEGEVFSLDDKRVIKICYPNLKTEQLLLNKNLKFTPKIYSLGKIQIPQRFFKKLSFLKFYHNVSTNPFIQRVHNVADLRSAKNTGLAYVIMEKLTPAFPYFQELVKEIRQNKPELNKFPDYNTIIAFTQFTINGNAAFILRDIKAHKEILNNKDFIIKHLPNTHKILFDIIKLRQTIDNSDFDYSELSDIHSNNFGYNNKGNLVLLDIKLDYTYNQPHKPLKHTIRESF